MLKALVFKLWSKVKNLICDVEEIKSKYIKKGEVNEEDNETTLTLPYSGVVLKLKNLSSNIWIISNPMLFELEHTLYNFNDILVMLTFPAIKLTCQDKSAYLYKKAIIKGWGSGEANIRESVYDGSSEVVVLEYGKSTFDIKNKPIKNIKYHNDATLSGTPKIIEFNLGSTPYYVKAYPNME